MADDVPVPLPRPGWAPFLLPGERVVLRYRIDRATSPRGEGMTDALGTIASVDESTVTVMTRRGPDVVPRALVIAAKQVPPPPVRRPRHPEPSRSERSPTDPPPPGLEP